MLIFYNVYILLFLLRTTLKPLRSVYEYSSRKAANTPYKNYNIIKMSTS